MPVNKSTVSKKEYNSTLEINGAIILKEMELFINKIIFQEYITEDDYITFLSQATKLAQAKHTKSDG